MGSVQIEMIKGNARNANALYPNILENVSTENKKNIGAD